MTKEEYIRLVETTNPAEVAHAVDKLSHEERRELRADLGDYPKQVRSLWFDYDAQVWF